jgi:hypothetical protein
MFAIAFCMHKIVSAYIPIEELSILVSGLIACVIELGFYHFSGLVFVETDNQSRLVFWLMLLIFCSFSMYFSVIGASDLGSKSIQVAIEKDTTISILEGQLQSNNLSLQQLQNIQNSRKGGYLLPEERIRLEQLTHSNQSLESKLVQDLETRNVEKRKIEAQKTAAQKSYNIRIILFQLVLFLSTWSQSRLTKILKLQQLSDIQSPKETAKESSEKKSIFQNTMN